MHVLQLIFVLAVVATIAYTAYRMGRANGRAAGLEEPVHVVLIHDRFERENLNWAVTVRGPFRGSEEMVRWMSEFEREMLGRDLHRRFRTSSRLVATNWSDPSPAEAADRVIKNAKPAPDPGAMM